MSAAGHQTPAEPPVFDPQVLAALFGGEVEITRSVLQTFITSMGEQMREFQQAAARQDPGLAAGAAHRIKGAARMSGAMALGQCAAGLESAARSGSAAWTDASWPALQTQWQRLREDPAFRHTLATDIKD